MAHTLPMKFVFQIAALVFWTLITGSAFGADDALVFQSKKVVSWLQD